MFMVIVKSCFSVLFPMSGQENVQIFNLDLEHGKIYWILIFGVVHGVFDFTGAGMQCGDSEICEMNLESYEFDEFVQDVLKEYEDYVYERYVLYDLLDRCIIRKPIRLYCFYKGREDDHFEYEVFEIPVYFDTRPIAIRYPIDSVSIPIPEPMYKYLMEKRPDMDKFKELVKKYVDKNLNKIFELVKKLGLENDITYELIDITLKRLDIEPIYFTSLGSY